MPDLDRTTLLTEIAAERARQQSQEGWSSDHDDSHDGGELAAAAAAYALDGTSYQQHAKGTDVPASWPWEEGAWKPRDARSNLIRAAALLVAEIERLDRSSASPVRERASEHIGKAFLEAWDKSKAAPSEAPAEPKPVAWPDEKRELLREIREVFVKVTDKSILPGNPFYDGVLQGQKNAVVALDQWLALLPPESGAPAEAFTAADEDTSDWRMGAYYYGFGRTGVVAIDRILSAVAHAGKSFHHTDSWQEDVGYAPDHLRGTTPVEWIWNAALDAARLVRERHTGKG